MGAKDNDPVYDYADGVKLNVYALKSGKSAKTEVYSQDNVVELTIEVANNSGTYDIRVNSEKSYQVVLVNAKTPVEVVGAEYTMNGDDVVIKASGSKNIIVKY